MAVNKRECARCGFVEGEKYDDHCYEEYNIPASTLVELTIPKGHTVLHCGLCHPIVTKDN